MLNVFHSDFEGFNNVTESFFLGVKLFGFNFPKSLKRKVLMLRRHFLKRGRGVCDFDALLYFRIKYGCIVLSVNWNLDTKPLVVIDLRWSNQGPRY